MGLLRFSGSGGGQILHCHARNITLDLLLELVQLSNSQKYGMIFNSTLKTESQVYVLRNDFASSFFRLSSAFAASA